MKGDLRRPARHHWRRAASGGVRGGGRPAAASVAADGASEVAPGSDGKVSVVVAAESRFCSNVADLKHKQTYRKAPTAAT